MNAPEMCASEPRRILSVFACLVRLPVASCYRSHVNYGQWALSSICNVAYPHCVIGASYRFWHSLTVKKSLLMRWQGSSVFCIGIGYRCRVSWEYLWHFLRIALHVCFGRRPARKHKITSLAWRPVLNQSSATIGDVSKTLK